MISLTLLDWCFFKVKSEQEAPDTLTTHFSNCLCHTEECKCLTCANLKPRAFDDEIAEWCDDSMIFWCVRHSDVVSLPFVHHP